MIYPHDNNNNKSTYQRIHFVTNYYFIRSTPKLLRRMDRLDEAQAAIEKAVELAPMDAQIGLEAGVIAVLSGREEAARQSWQSVIDAQPASLAAKTAQDYLKQLGPAPTEETPTQ